MANTMSLPSGRVFAILAYSTVSSKAGMLETIYSTRSGSEFAKLCGQIRELSAPLPKLREPTKGNRRPVVILELKDQRALDAALRVGSIPAPLKVGQTFDTLQAAGEALGLGKQSIRTIFARVRHSNKGQEVAVFIRGYLLNYVDPKVGREARKDKNRRPGPTFENSSLTGQRQSLAEVRQITAGLRRQHRNGKQEDEES